MTLDDLIEWLDDLSLTGRALCVNSRAALLETVGISEVYADGTLEAGTELVTARDGALLLEAGQPDEWDCDVAYAVERFGGPEGPIVRVAWGWAEVPRIG